MPNRHPVMLLHYYMYVNNGAIVLIIEAAPSLEEETTYE